MCLFLFSFPLLVLKGIDFTIGNISHFFLGAKKQMEVCNPAGTCIFDSTFTGQHVAVGQNQWDAILG